MTNEEKTKELADFLYFKLSHIDYGTLTEKLLEMAEWKDEKFDAILLCVKNSFEKLGEQKPAWNGADEAGFGYALWAIEQARSLVKDENDMGNLWYAERWLKSLKDRMKGE